MPLPRLFRFVLICLAATAWLIGGGSSRAEEPTLPAAIHMVVREGAVPQWLGVKSLPFAALDQFYAARQYQPAWHSPQGEIAAVATPMLNAMHQADLEGLNPADYHGDALLRHLKEEQPDSAAWDVAMTAMALRYIQDVAYGKAKTRPRTYLPQDYPDADLATPTALLGMILASRSPENTIASLPPPHEGYKRLRRYLHYYRRLQQAKGEWPVVPAGAKLEPGREDRRIALLRERLMHQNLMESVPVANPAFYGPELKAAVERFQAMHNLEPDGVVGKGTLAAINVPLGERIEQIRINMERWRWLPRTMEPRYILVNLAGFWLEAVEQGGEVIHMKVISGKPVNPTPTMRSVITDIIFYPYWHVPNRIAVQKLLPKIQDNPGYLEQHGFEVYERGGGRVDPDSIDWYSAGAGNFPYLLRQDPGPKNSLGVIRFTLKNDQDIYLHGTPEVHLFKKDTRALSSGCVRVEDPKRLAEFALSRNPGWDAERVRQACEVPGGAGKSSRVTLAEPIATYLYYWTAWVDGNDVLYFTSDIYGHDASLRKAFFN